jgi:hypothetical protein
MNAEPDYSLPGWEEPEPDLETLIECVRREIRYRRQVYPKRVERGKMSRKLMERELRLMEAVLKNLEGQRVRQ